MIGAIPTGGVQFSQRIGGAEAPARVPENREDEDPKRAPVETSSKAAVRVPPAGPGGASAFNAQVAAQDRENPDERNDDEADARSEASEAKSDASEEKSDARSETAESKETEPGQLSEDERRQVRSLQARDREVRAHEAAHQAAGGALAGAASFTLQKGPDGRSYAVGGEVPINAGPIAGDPDATIAKLRTVKRAALAPAEPSSADRRIASSADSGVRQAQLEKRRQASEERSAKAAENVEARQSGSTSTEVPTEERVGPAEPAGPGRGQERAPEFGTGNAAQQTSGGLPKNRPPGSTLSLLA